MVPTRRVYVTVNRQWIGTDLWLLIAPYLWPCRSGYCLVYTTLAPITRRRNDFVEP